MPKTLMLRRLPDELVGRLRAYADRKGLGQRDAAVTLIDAGLRVHEQAVQAGHARRRGGGVMDGGVMDAEEGVER